MSAANLPRRYPGLKPFERSQSALFRGRSEDVQRLTNLIVRERLVVLFAKSGIGKTSLMQAGVAPMLEEQGFVPVFLRADNTDAPIAQSLTTSLAKHPAVGGREDKAVLPDTSSTLWEEMKRLEFDLDGLPATPVLVLDQFEEVFTLGHSDVSRSRFVEQLADLANEAMPEAIRNRLMKSAQSSDNTLGQDDLQWWEKQPDLRIVISIRSDFLHLLDDISPLIPGILRNRYQLQPLNRRQATEAIEAPAAAEGEFASPQFSYAPEALDVILNYLAGRETSAEVMATDTAGLLKKQDEIESFNLQILCQHIEQKVILENRPTWFQVTPDFYSGKEGLEREIREFYIKQIKSLPEAYTRRTGLKVDDPSAFTQVAQRLIEEDLVTQAGRRCSVVDDSLTDRWKVSQDFLDTLVESRLLRKELRLDDFYYEITHDTLLPAILDARELRRQQEREDSEKQRLAEELRQEALKRVAMEHELQETRKQRRLARMVSLLAVGMLALTAGFGVWFARTWAKSVVQEFRAAEENCRNEQFDAARAQYLTLADNETKNWLLGGNVAAKGEDALRFKRLYDATHRTLALGDSLFFFETPDGSSDIAGALGAYRSAADSLEQYASINYQWTDSDRYTWWRVNPGRIAEQREALKLRIESTQRTLITQFIVRQREAEAFKEAGITGQQCRNLRSMFHLLPDHPEDARLLHDALNLPLNETVHEYVRRELLEAGCGL